MQMVQMVQTLAASDLGLYCLPMSLSCGGWSGSAKVLGKFSVPGRPTNLDYSRARAYCTCSRCGWGCLYIFSLVYHFSLLSPSLWETARYRLEYCLKEPLSPKQPTNPFMERWSCVFSLHLRTLKDEIVL